MKTFLIVFMFVCRVKQNRKPGLLILILLLIILLPGVQSINDPEPDFCNDALSGADPETAKYGQINQSTDSDWFKGTTSKLSLLRVTLSHDRYKDYVFLGKKLCANPSLGECPLTSVIINTGFNTCNYSVGPGNHHFEVKGNGASASGNNNYSLVVENKCSNNQCIHFDSKSCINTGSTNITYNLYCDTGQQIAECSNDYNIPCQKKGNKKEG